MKKLCSIVVLLFAVLIAYGTQTKTPQKDQPQYRKVIRDSVDSMIHIFKDEIYVKGKAAAAGYANIFIDGVEKNITCTETDKNGNKYEGVLKDTKAHNTDSCKIKIYMLPDSTFLLYSLADTSYIVKDDNREVILKKECKIRASPFRYYTKGALCNYVNSANLLINGTVAGDSLEKREVKIITCLDTTKYCVSYNKDNDSIIINFPNTVSLLYKKNNLDAYSLNLNAIGTDSVYSFEYPLKDSLVELIVKMEDDFYVIPSNQLKAAIIPVPPAPINSLLILLVILLLLAILLLLIILFWWKKKKGNKNQDHEKLRYSWYNVEKSFDDEKALEKSLKDDYHLNNETITIILANNKIQGKIKIPVIKLLVDNLDVKKLESNSIVYVGTEKELKIPINLSLYNSKLEQQEIIAKFGSITASTVFKLNKKKCIPSEQDVQKLKSIDQLKDLFSTGVVESRDKRLDLSTWTKDTLNDKIASEKKQWETSLIESFCKAGLFSSEDEDAKPNAEDTDILPRIVKALTDKIALEKKQWETSLIKSLYGVRMELDNWHAVNEKIEKLSGTNGVSKNNGSELLAEINAAPVTKDETVDQHEVESTCQSNDSISIEDYIKQLSEKINSELKDQAKHVEQLVKSQEEALKPYVDKVVFADELEAYCRDIITFLDVVSSSAEFVVKLNKEQFSGTVLQRIEDAEKRYLKSYHDNKIGGWYQQLRFLVDDKGIILKKSEVFKCIEQYYIDGKLNEQGIGDFKVSIYNCIISTFGGEVLAMMAYVVGCLRKNGDKLLLERAEQYDRNIKQILTDKLGLSIHETYLFDSSSNNGGITIMGYEDKDNYKDVTDLNERDVVNITKYAINLPDNGNNKTEIKVVAL